MNLQFVKAGTSDAPVLTGISKQAFDSDVEAGADSSCGPPGYQSVSFHVKMARMNHLFKLADGNGVIPCFETDGEGMDVYLACR